MIEWLYEGEENEEEFNLRMAALEELRKDYGPPELYPEYTLWEDWIYCSN